MMRLSVDSNIEWRTHAKCCRACAAFILIAVDCWFLISALKTRNRFPTVAGWSAMKGAQLVGMFVVIGSSRVSLSRMAEKSKARERSRMQSAWKRLSVMILDRSGRCSALWLVIAIYCMACCVEIWLIKWSTYCKLDLKMAKSLLSRKLSDILRLTFRFLILWT